MFFLNLLLPYFIITAEIPSEGSVISNEYQAPMTIQLGHDPSLVLDTVHYILPHSLQALEKNHTHEWKYEYELN